MEAKGVECWEVKEKQKLPNEFVNKKVTLYWQMVTLANMILKKNPKAYGLVPKTTNVQEWHIIKISCQIRLKELFQKVKRSSKW